MLISPDEFDVIVEKCKNSVIGKRLPTALYVHQTALSCLDKGLQDYEEKARLASEVKDATIVKFNTDKPKISYLFYPDFINDPHPALTLSIVVDLMLETVKFWDYTDTHNPPILHRKETFISPESPHYEGFKHLSFIEEKLGLLDNSRYIGTRQDWENRLTHYHLTFIDHYLACHLPIGYHKTFKVEIDRHKAAIVRTSLSRPVRLALDIELFTSPETTFFDYGCGYGGDIERIAKQGYTSAGYDPYYRPDDPLIASDIVNLGYVINVIEDLQERRETLLAAWELTHQILIVSAQVLINDRTQGLVAYGDGVITSRNTFQKYYEQEELKAYIDQVLENDAIPIGLGVYLVFRDENKAQTFRLSRYHSSAKTPRIYQNLPKFEDHEPLLTPLMEFYTQRGRLPVKGEFPTEEEIKAEFGTFRRAFKVILQVTEQKDWDAIADKRTQDILLYLALSHFSHRPSVRKLPAPLKADIRAFFGSYQQACSVADLMLCSLRDLHNMAKFCFNSPVGKKLNNSLLVHLSALEDLPLMLRLYEGCASQAMGRLEEANVVRLFFNKAKIAYLYYPDFDSNPHPILQTKMMIYMGKATVSYQDYTCEPNPPILHEKDQLVSADYPLYDTFHQLSQQERELGLFDDYKAISLCQGWLSCLAKHQVKLNGHNIQSCQ
ncbi:MAG: DNA phosphorothioation-associated putative methyltransferase [Microcystaceae cyanobacterium]